MKHRVKILKKKEELRYQAQVSYTFFPFIWFWLNPHGEVLWLPHTFKLHFKASKAIKKHKERQPTYRYA